MIKATQLRELKQHFRKLLQEELRLARFRETERATTCSITRACG
jgi:hypothetical protein